MYRYLTLFCLSLCVPTWGCGDKAEPSITVEVSELGGLTEGAAVKLGGVKISEVSSIAVADGHVSVSFPVKAEVFVPRAGACAKVAKDTPPSLTIDPGEGALLEGAVPACPKSLLEQMGEVTKQVTDVTKGVKAVAEELTGDLKEQTREVTKQAAREAGRQTGESAKEFAKGLKEGVGDFREAGKELGKAAREISDGVAEGAQVQ